MGDDDLEEHSSDGDAYNMRNVSLRKRKKRGKRKKPNAAGKADGDESEGGETGRGSPRLTLDFSNPTFKKEQKRALRKFRKSISKKGS